MQIIELGWNIIYDMNQLLFGTQTWINPFYRTHPGISGNGEQSKNRQRSFKLCICSPVAVVDDFRAPD